MQLWYGSHLLILFKHHFAYYWNRFAKFPVTEYTSGTIFDLSLSCTKVNYVKMNLEFLTNAGWYCALYEMSQVSCRTVYLILELIVARRISFLNVRVDLWPYVIVWSYNLLSLPTIIVVVIGLYPWQFEWIHVSY